MKIKVLRVVTANGVYYNREENRPAPQNLTLVQSSEVITMEEEEYNAIPASEDAARFFAGERIGSRPE